MAEPRLPKRQLVFYLWPDSPERGSRREVMFQAHLVGRLAWQGTKWPLFSEYAGRYRFMVNPRLVRLSKKAAQEGWQEREWCHELEPLCHLLNRALKATLTGNWLVGHRLFWPHPKRRGEIILDTRLLEAMTRFIDGQLKGPAFTRAVKRWALSWELSSELLEQVFRAD
jgi:hypothetical protein